jgi:hypothetical protein
MPHLLSSHCGRADEAGLFQYAKGDTVGNNPAQTALVRAANMQETTSFYRHDLARKLFPKLHPAGHFFTIPDTSISNSLRGSDSLAQYVIAMLAQEQAAGFLASHGTEIPDVNIWSKMWFGVELFEAPPSS